MRRRAFAFLFVSMAMASSAFAYRMSSWMPLYASGGLQSTQVNASRLTESNPVWYEFRADGSIVAMAGAEDPTWRAAMTGTQILPTVQNLVGGGFDQAIAVQVLSSAATREAHAEAIFQIVVSRAYDGIDIDYEKLPYSSRANFVAFLEVLSAKLHAAGKKLSVTVYAKTSDSPTWDGAGGHDYAGIGRVADYVKLMVYPFSYSGTAPGPLSPLDWIDQVVTYATSAIPAPKVIVGLPWYGKDFDGATAKSVTFPKVLDLIAANNPVIGRDAHGEATFTYGSHTVFYNDAQSYDRKVDVVLQRHPAVGGFAHWASGQEDPAVWTRVGALKLTAPATTTPVPTATGNTLVASGAAWRYLDTGSDQGSAWRSTTFNDSTWKSGAGQFGYGDYDEKTVIGYGGNASNKFVTAYFRYTFDLADPNAFSALKLRLIRDDGAVVYLNGTEVFRDNMPAGAIGYTTLAAADAQNESVFLEASLDARYLVAGRNVVAVEIHQSNVASSDTSFDLELTGTTAAPPPPPPAPTTGTLIAPGSQWRYLDNGSDPGSAWSAPSFSDAAWKTGAAQFGYGDGDEATVISSGSKKTRYVTTYFRRAFQVADPAAVRSLLLKLLRDDGAVVYVNGTEVWRSNMPTGAIGYRTYAAGDASDESTFLEKALSPGVLVPGTNVIAVEIHQSSASSSDVSFDLALAAN